MSIPSPEELAKMFGDDNKQKGGFRKIAEPQRQQLCPDREHNPPGYISLSPGTYEYTCPSCGHKQIVNVPLITL